jgi:hypothetical protein
VGDEGVMGEVQEEAFGQDAADTLAPLEFSEEVALEL